MVRHDNSDGKVCDFGSHVRVENKKCAKSLKVLSNKESIGGKAHHFQTMQLEAKTYYV